MNLKVMPGGKTEKFMINIIEKLLKSPENFAFFQAVRVLEECHKSFYFKHNASLIFPVGEISKISLVDSRYEINTNIMGLIGPTGVLPNHLTSLIIERLAQKDYTLRNFLDVLQHRLVNLFYLSWKKNHYYADKQSKNAQILLSLIGQGTPYLNNRENIPDEIMLYYASQFSRQRRSLLGLEAILIDYFDTSIRIKIFQKKWMQLTDNEQSQLSCHQIKKFNQLGVNAHCGQRQLQYQYHFSVVINLLNIEKFMSFLPDQTNFSLLIAMTRRYAGIENSFDIRLKLNAKAIPSCKPGELQSARLGWNTWLKIREYRSDVDNPVLYIRSW